MTTLCFLGQAGFLITGENGERLAIDPYLSDCVERVEQDHMGYKRLLPKIFHPEEMNLDVLICTHFHRDHYDVDSVPIIMMNPKTQLLCPEDCKNDTQNASLDFERIHFVKPGDNIEHGGFSIHLVNCDHGSGAPKAVGVIVEIDGKRILEVGDTCLRLDRISEYKAFGEIDVLIAPINGMYGNMNEVDCIKLAEAINPQIMIPCHFGMFADHRGNPGELNKLMQNKRMPYILMTMGEEYHF